MHFHYARECIIARDIDLQHVGTDHQTNDIFTKSLGANKLHLFSLALSLRPLNTPSLCSMLEGEELKTSDCKGRNQETDEQEPTTLIAEPDEGPG